MMNIESIINTLKSHLPFLQKQFHVEEIGLFGSFTKQEHDEKSDIDILVVLQDEYNDLFNFIRLKNYLEEIFHRDVDLVLKEGIKPRIKEKILKEVIYV